MLAEVMSKVKEHTLGCSSSPKLCKPVAKQLGGALSSATGIVLAHNNSEEDLRFPVGGPKAITPVFVLNKDSSPLMPCTPAKARHLLQGGKAEVVSRKPFTIQLLWNCEQNTQPVTLGLDPGYALVGFSAVTAKKELVSGEVKLRTDVSKKLTERRMYRRNRRSRLWYRPTRFLNRRRPKGWLPPSVQHKLDSHLRLVTWLKKLLPITKIVVEVANFDIQKIKNPNIKSKQYQEGEQKGFWNVREYVLWRDNYTCQKCHGRSGDKVLQVHHIRGRKNGATNRPEELITVCKTCHERHHKGIDLIKVKKIKDFKAESFMSTIRWKLVDKLKELSSDVSITYGYLTKMKRIELNLPKTHSNDAFVIGGGDNQLRTNPFYLKQVRRNNRRLERLIKGKRCIRRQRYKLQPGDLVRYNDKLWTVGSVIAAGTSVALKNKDNQWKYPSPKKVELICHGKGFYWEG